MTSRSGGDDEHRKTEATHAAEDPNHFSGRRALRSLGVLKQAQPGEFVQSLIEIGFSGPVYPVNPG
jgi:hypothetical protein